VRSGAAFGVATASLAVLAAALVATPRSDARARRSLEFQRLVGGLGAGPAVDLDACDPDFDPRVGAVCRGETAPLPGGGAFCPHRGGSALFRTR